MEIKPHKAFYVTYGCAAKPSFDMTPSEFKVAGDAILKRAKEKAFSRGLPVYYGRDGRVVAEYADGRMEFVEKL